MLKKSILLLVLLLALMTALAWSGCSPTPQENPSLKIGSMPRIYDLIVYAAKQEGLFEKQKISVEIVPFRSNIEMNTALLAGGLDGAIQGTYEAINLNKEEETTKLLGHAFMPKLFEVVASAGSGINSAAQLKGKEIAVSTGTITEYALDKLLTAEGVSSKEITKVNVPSVPLRVEMMNQGKLPAAILTSPASDQAILGGARLIVNDVKQPFGGPGVMFSINALNAKSDTIGRFIQAWQQAVDLINANPQKYHSLLMTTANIPEAIGKSISVPQFPKLGVPDKAEYESVIKWMIGTGLINQPVPYEKIVETKYIK